MPEKKAKATKPKKKASKKKTTKKVAAKATTTKAKTTKKSVAVSKSSAPEPKKILSLAQAKDAIKASAAKSASKIKKVVKKPVSKTTATKKTKEEPVKSRAQIVAKKPPVASPAKEEVAKEKSQTKKDSVVTVKQDDVKESVPLAKPTQEESLSDVSEKVDASEGKDIETIEESQEEEKVLELATPITVRDLAQAMEIKPTELVAKLIKQGIFASVNQSIQHELASKIALDYGFKIEEPHVLESDLVQIHHETDESKRVARSPIVTFMGHVDHGKTSLLDAIRKTKVVDSESGGITQHIGAYQVFLEKGSVTFLDTPGHEAFTAMRARGAKSTDVVVLVIAADSGIMPQTKEAIHHAKAAEVPIVVAINKCDLPTANIERVKQHLTEHELTPEDWGGKTITIDVSAKTGAGIDQLLDMLLLESELLELKANPEAPARGSVVEAELSKGSGALATMLVQDGTLKISDMIVSGSYFGRVKAMINDHGKRIKEAGPSTPVVVLGLSGVPQAGDPFYVVKDEVKAREFIEQKNQDLLDKSRNSGSHITLEELYSQIKAGNINTLNLIVKADVQGSVEALTNMLQNIPSDQVKLNVIHAATGDVSRSDAMLATASNAIIVGFHIGIASDAIEVIKREGVDVRLYEVIYEAHSAVRKALEGLLDPESIKKVIGTAEVRQVFKISKVGAIAGSKVLKGKIIRNADCRVIRQGKVIYEGKVTGLKRFKNDAKEVLEGYECGISCGNFTDFETGDQLEVSVVEEKAQTLRS